MYQLRRYVSCDSRGSSSQPYEEEVVPLYETTKIGRNPEAVDVVLTSTVHSNMISRLHSTIDVRQDKAGRLSYILNDKSLNGTYINDYRVNGPTELKVGDVIKFGHVNGAAIKAGCHGPQHSAEFTFIFEKAPPERVMERRRPITIVGGARSGGDSATTASTLPSQAAAASRFQLPTTSVDFAPTWQNPAASAAAATSTFYNLQRFPGYYPSFTQLNPAYLHIWNQTSWQPQATAHQLQQHQMQQQQNQKQHQQQQALAPPNTEQLVDQGGLVDSRWIGASASGTPDLGSQSGVSAAGHFRAPAIHQTVPQTQQLVASAPAPQITTAQTTTPVQRFTPNFPSSMMPAGANLLSSFQRMYQQQPTTSMNTSGMTNMPSAVPNSAAITAGFPLPAAATSVHSQFAAASPSSVPAVSPATNADNVKRMECDSSVPSPPKTQQQQQSNGGTPQFTSHGSAVSSGGTPTGGGQTAGSPAVHSSVLPSSSTTAMLLTKSKTASQTQGIAPAEGQLKPAQARVSEPISRCEFTPPSPDSETGVTEGDASLKTGSLTLETKTSEATPSKPEDAKVEQEIKEITRPRSRSRSHHSPKRRGHGHSESSRSRSPTPVLSDHGKATAKRHRKNNELASLLNDLTEGSYMRLVRKSSHRSGAGKDRSRKHSTDGSEGSKSSSDEDSDESDAGVKKPAKRPGRKAKQKPAMPVSDANKPKRGRPKGTKQRVSISKDEENKSKVFVKRRKSAPESGSSSVESEPEEKPKRKGRKSTAMSDDSEDEAKPARPRRGRPPGLRLSGIATLPKKRGRPPARKRSPSDDDRQSPESPVSSSSVSPSPPPRRRVVIEQRKVGMAPSGSARKPPPAMKRKIAVSAKRGRKKKPGRKPGAFSGVTAKRRKKNSTTSNTSATETNSDEEPTTTSKPVLDEWAYHDPEKQCDAKSKCKKPQGDNVVWVQCDYCDLWYHVECVVGYAEVLDDGSEFDCGCRKKPGRRKVRK